MTLFTKLHSASAGTTIPVGAYTVYPIPAKDKWTLAVNKNVTAGAGLRRKAGHRPRPMETDQIGQPSK